MDAAPGYAKAKFACELREVLSVLAQAEVSRANLSSSGARSMSKTVDRHIAKALASFADLPKRELEATADALQSRRHSLHAFARRVPRGRLVARVRF